MGLGPSTVVGLECALAHEVLRYCTAIRGSVLKVVQGTRLDHSTDSTGKGIPTVSEPLIGHNRKPAATQNCVGCTGMRKRPSIQAWSTVREPTGHGQTRAVCPCAVPPNRSKAAYGGPAGLSLSGDTQVNTRFGEHEHYDLDPRTAPVRAERCQAPHPHLRPQHMHRLWKSVWKKEHKMLERPRDRRGLRS